jgi:phospholipase/lecithinase/hemolysin
MNLPNIGYTPRQNWDAAQAAGGDFISASYNTALSASVAAIAGNRDIVIHDAYTWTSNLVDNLQEGGLNGTDACIVDADLSAASGQAQGMCSDPSNYLWWDSIHPTTVGHALLTDDVIGTINQLDVATVPVPAAAWLFISGIVGLIGAKKVRK